MLEIIDNLLSRPVYYTIFYATQAIVFTLIMWFMIFRSQDFINLVISGGLLIAVGAGMIVVALPLFLVSPLLVPVGVLLGGIIPLWMVFGD
jgi:hypothetical protein